MRKNDSISLLSLAIGLIFSIGLHAALFCAPKSTSTPARPQMKQGRTTIKLTLPPSKPAAPEPTTTEEPTQPPETPTEPPLPKPVLTKPLSPQSPKIPKNQTPQKTIQKKESPNPPQQKTTPPPATSHSEQNTTTQQHKGVNTEASPRSLIIPTYPRSSQRRGEQGSVTLSIEVLPDGSPGEITIISSSGFKRLDQAATKAAQNAQYAPAKKNGKPVSSKIIQPIAFQLTNS